MAKTSSPWARPSLTKFNSNIDDAPQDGTIIEVRLYSGAVVKVAWRLIDPNANLVTGCWFAVSDGGRWLGRLQHKPKCWRFVPSQERPVGP